MYEISFRILEEVVTGGPHGRILVILGSNCVPQDIVVSLPDYLNTYLSAQSIRYQGFAAVCEHAVFWSHVT